MRVVIRTILVVKGVGIVLFQLPSKHSPKVVEVLYVPGLKTNLL